MTAANICVQCASLDWFLAFSILGVGFLFGYVFRRVEK